MHDIVVIGGGPAGMTAALYALRNNKKVLVLEKQGFGGQIAYSPKVENYPGTKRMSGEEFADRFLDQILSQGAEIEFAAATGIRDRGAEKLVVTEEGGEYPCRAAVIAVGVRHRLLGIDREKEYIGNGISFCAVCDGDFYRGKVVAVAGGGNSAVQEAMLLADVCGEVVIIQDLDYFTAEKRALELLLARPNVRAVTGTLVEGLIEEGGAFRGVRLRPRQGGPSRELRCDGLFVAIGMEPQNEAFRGLVPLDAAGYIACGEDCLTGREGVFAAGDCRAKSLRQLTTAVSDGAAAAVAACRYIDAGRR